MTKKIGVDPDRVFGLQKDYGVKAHIAMNENDEQFFDGLEALLKANPQQLEAFIQEVLKRKSWPGSFFIKEVFQQEPGVRHNFYFGQKFEETFWTPIKMRLVASNTLGENILKDYELPENMSDTAIQNVADAKAMSEDQLWVLLRLLIVNPKVGKKILGYELRKNKVYMLHVELIPGKVFTVAIGHKEEGGSRLVDSFDFNQYSSWSSGYIYLYLSAKE